MCWWLKKNPSRRVKANKIAHVKDVDTVNLKRTKMSIMLVGDNNYKTHDKTKAQANYRSE